MEEFVFYKFYVDSSGNLMGSHFIGQKNEIGKFVKTTELFNGISLKLNQTSLILLNGRKNPRRIEISHWPFRF